MSTTGPSRIRKRITRNAAQCLGCNEVIESLHRHDFKWCKCRALAVDGGLDYAKRLTTTSVPWVEMVETVDVQVFANPLQVVQNWVEQRKQLENSREEND